MHSDGFEVLLLTGFLGSGKTTLLKTFLESTDATDIGVVVNEIGEIDVDGAVLTQSADKVPLALLSNGCICCAGDGDLAGTIAMLQEERARRGMASLRRVIVEASGAARPGPVLRGLQLLGSRARTTCVSTFDAQHWRRAISTSEGQAQLAGAQRLVITKTDCASPEAVELAAAAARAGNPLADVIASSSPEERARLALSEPGGPEGMSREPLAPCDYATGTADVRLSTAVVRFTAPVAYDGLAEWLDNAAGLLGERLYRTKGFVRINQEGRRLFVQGVGTTFAQPVLFPGDGQDSFLVLIGESLETRELQSIEPALPCRISLGKRASSPIGRPLAETLA